VHELVPALITAVPKGDSIGTFAEFPGLVNSGDNEALFNPEVAGAGTHVITFEYRDATNELRTIEDSVFVDSIEEVTISEDLATDYCIDDNYAVLTGNPSGGEFEGNRVKKISADVYRFYPDEIPYGSLDTVKYRFVSNEIFNNKQSTCIKTVFKEVMIHELPIVELLTESAYCQSNAPVVIYGTPPGSAGINSTYSGPNLVELGDTAASFTPSLASTDTIGYNLFYTYSDSNSCTNTDTSSIIVHKRPTIVEITGIEDGYCRNFDNVEFGGRYKYESIDSLYIDAELGFFNGNGIINEDDSIAFGIFSPVQAYIEMDSVVGNTDVIFSLIDTNSCIFSTTNSVTIYDLPQVNISAQDSICNNASPIALNGTPTGLESNWQLTQGSSITAPGDEYTVDPVNYNPGLVNVKFWVTDDNTCTDTTYQTLTILDLPVVELFTEAEYCEGGDADTIIGTPRGSAGFSFSYSGPNLVELGDSAAKFTPLESSGIEGYNLLYTFTDDNKCSNNWFCTRKGIL